MCVCVCDDSVYVCVFMCSHCESSSILCVLGMVQTNEEFR